MPDTSTRFLRSVLRVDASSCLLFGVALFALAAPLSDSLGASVGELRGLGISLLLSAAFMAFASQNVPALRWPVWVVVLGNASWVLGSALIVIREFSQLSALSSAGIVAQALLVALIAELEFTGLRKISSRKHAAAT
jgi:hypothetical protein